MRAIAPKLPWFQIILTLIALTCLFIVVRGEAVGLRLTRKKRIRDAVDRVGLALTETRWLEPKDVPGLQAVWRNLRTVLDCPVIRPREAEGWNDEWGEPSGGSKKPR